MAGEDDEFRNLGFEEAPAHFRSAMQIARVQTEAWAQRWLFCPNCAAPRLASFAANRPGADLYCPDCAEEFELKSARRLGRKVPDGAYGTMRARVRARNNPNLVLLRYDATTQSATDVLLIPRHFFVEDILEEKPPTLPKGRSAPWIGCNILIDRVPDAGRIPLLQSGTPAPRETVREHWRSTLFLRERSIDARGWLLDVMKAVEAIGRREFTLADIYAQEARLQAAYPGNRNVRPKIRQQLQVLRDAGFLEFLGGGAYRLRG